MGHRANLVLIEKKGYRLFYSHWAGTMLPEDIFWGPEQTLEYFRAHSEVEPDDWQDCVLGEGGVLMDRYKQHLIVYGCSYVATDLPVRRLFLEALKETWPGWTIQYAYNGVLDLAEYVGYEDMEDLYSDHIDIDWNLQEDLSPPEYRESMNLVGSITDLSGRTQLFPLSGDLDCYLKLGPRLTKYIDKHGQSTLDTTEWTESFPISGWHVDMPNRTVSFWKSNPETNLHKQLISRWTGWAIHNLNDNYESHVAEVNDCLKLPQRSREKLAELLQWVLLEEKRFDGPNFLLGILARQAKKGDTPNISPSAFSDPAEPWPSLERRKQIVEKVISKLAPDAPRPVT
ncbi:MAG: hypothetical protein QNK37_01985 [Acidobacteriota bacterium]|nr:hypothetical protein [Acidobacteriota bacterium]